MRKLLYIFVFCFLVFLPNLAFANNLKPLGLAELSALISENSGRVVVVNFFASWCPPCREELPLLASLSQDQKLHNVTFIGVSVDEDISKVPPLLEKYKINYPVFLAKMDLIRSFALSTIPYTVFYDKAGKLAISANGLIAKEQFLKIFEDLGK